MDKPIFTAFSPNVEGDDIVRSLLFFLTPWRWRQGRYPVLLEEEFKNRFKVSYASTFESGRSALYAILRSFGFEKNDEVLLQAFTCVAVPNAVIWAGLKPVYVDIDESTLNMSDRDIIKKITPRTRAIIVQHTFGLPADMKRILEVARMHNIAVIEDCAHSLGARYLDREVGSFGDAAFFSFGRDKVISSVFGGIVITNNKVLGEKILNFQKSLPQANIVWTAKQVIHPALSAFLRSTHCKCAGRIGRIFLKVALGLRLITKAVMPQEKRGIKAQWSLRKMPNALAAFAYYQMQKLERFNSHRKKIAAYYRQELSEFPATVFDNNAIYLRYAVRTKNAGEIIAKAKKKDIFLGDWYRQGVAPAGVNYQAIHYDPAQCPIAERVSLESIKFPTSIGIKEMHAVRVVAILKN